MVGRAAQGAKLLMAMTLAQRLLTFAMNTALVRRTQAEVLGFAAHDMELLLSTVLFLAREGVRLTALRSNTEQASSATQSLVNLAWLVPPLGCVLAAGACTVFSRGAGSAEEQATVLAFGLAAIVECFTEPAYVLAAGSLRFDVRVRAEGAAIFAKTLTTAGAVLGFGLASSAFAVGQLAYAAVLVGVYLHWAASDGVLSRLLPRALTAEERTLGNFILASHLQLGGAFWGQGVLKHLLTEGDRLVLVSTASRQEKGVYSVVTNLGSLAPRLVFQPLEEAGRALFGRLALQTAQQGPSARHAVQASWTTLAALLRLVLLVGCTFACFGAPFTGVLVSLLLPGRWVGLAVPQALALYCLYVAALALNGMTEAFVFATASQAALFRLNLRMVCISLAYCAAAWLAVGPAGLGVPGLIGAGALNMLLRSASSTLHIHQHFAAWPDVDVSLANALPAPQTLLVAAVASAACHAAGLWLGTHPFSVDLASAALTTKAQHTAVGVVAIGAFAATAYVFDGSHFAKAWSLLRSARSPAAHAKQQ